MGIAEFAHKLVIVTNGRKKECERKHPSAEMLDSEGGVVSARQLTCGSQGFRQHYIILRK